MMTPRRDDDDEDYESEALIGDWDEWKRYVLAELRAARSTRKEMQSKLDTLIAAVGVLDKSFAILQLKAGGWGILGGMIAGAAGILYGIFHKN